MARSDGPRCRPGTVVIQLSPFGIPASGDRVPRRTGNALQQRRLLTPGVRQTPVYAIATNLATMCVFRRKPM